MSERIKMRATDHFYDSNLNPKHVRRGDVFEVADKVVAKDFAHVAEVYTGKDAPKEQEPKVSGEPLGVERKSRETPLNKMKPASENKGA